MKYYIESIENNYAELHTVFIELTDDSQYSYVGYTKENKALHPIREITVERSDFSFKLSQIIKRINTAELDNLKARSKRLKGEHRRQFFKGVHSSFKNFLEKYEHSAFLKELMHTPEELKSYGWTSDPIMYEFYYSPKKIICYDKEDESVIVIEPLYNPNVDCIENLNLLKTSGGLLPSYKIESNDFITNEQLLDINKGVYKRLDFANYRVLVNHLRKIEYDFELESYLRIFWE